MADELNLEAFLSDISARDDFLKNSAPGTGPDLLPPVRGAPVVEEITKPRSTKKAPKAAAAVAAPPSGPKDEADIWDAAEVPSLQDEARPATAPATSGGNGIPAAAKEVKPRQRKHAYEYFNQWDAYDVEAECDKVDGGALKMLQAQDLTLPSFTDRVHVGPTDQPGAEKDVLILSRGASPLGDLPPPPLRAVAATTNSARLMGEAVPCDVVVWNPHAAASPPDLPPPAYLHFVCVEPGLVAAHHTLPAGGQALICQKIVPAG